MWSGGGEVRVAHAAEDPKMTVGGLGAVKGEEGSATINGFGGVTIKEVCGGVKGVSPISWRKAGPKQK